MGSFAHSPGFQDWDLTPTGKVPKAYDLQAEMDRAERLLELYQKLLWHSRLCEHFSIGRGPFEAIKPHVENMMAVLDEIEALESGAPLCK
jgi:hypothetical protein